MNSQMIIGGGHKMEDTPQFRSALEKRQLMLMKEFDQKLKNFDFESERIDHDKAQAEKYRSILLKQKVIWLLCFSKKCLKAIHWVVYHAALFHRTGCSSPHIKNTERSSSKMKLGA